MKHNEVPFLDKKRTRIKAPAITLASRFLEVSHYHYARQVFLEDRIGPLSAGGAGTDPARLRTVDQAPPTPLPRQLTSSILSTPYLGTTMSKNALTPSVWCIVLPKPDLASLTFADQSGNAQMPER